MTQIRALLYGALFVALSCAPVYGQKGKARPQAPKTRPQGVEFATVLDALEKAKPYARGPEAVIDKLRDRCFAFAATPEQLEQLRRAGATDELLSWIPRIPPPPPLPKPVFAGALSVRCNLEDCSVLVNGQDRGRTVKGSFEVNHLPPGDTYVEARRDGYVSRLEKLTLEPDKPANVAFSLTPDPHLSQRAGTELFMKMIRRFGGVTGGSRSSSLTAAGRMVIAAAGAQKIERPVLVEVALPETFKVVTMNGKKRQCAATYRPASQNTEFICENKKSSDAELKSHLERAVRMLASHYPPLVADSLLAGQFEFRGPDSGATEAPVLLRAGAKSEMYQFHLGKEFLPDWIGHTGTDNVTWTIEFASYEYPSFFPRKVSIRNPDKTSITDFVFDSVAARK